MLIVLSCVIRICGVISVILCYQDLQQQHCYIPCLVYCVLLGLAAAQLHSMPLISCYPVLSCVFPCYQGWQQHSYIPCLLYVLSMLSCVTVWFCVLSGLAAAALLHTMPLISCYQCYPVFLCVIRVGSSTVTLHASDTVLSCVIIVCYCVLSRLAIIRLLHTMPGFLLCYQC